MEWGEDAQIDKLTSNNQHEYSRLDGLLHGVLDGF